jgi:hypothetical protein
MNGLQSALSLACAQLGLDIQFDKTLSFENQSCIEAPAHILNIGAPKGMLIFTDAAAMWPFREAIRAAGYGYSVLDNRPDDRASDICAFADVFKDWGWSGEAEKKPAWFG